MRCEDFPCCGHTADDPCPERDKNGDIVGRCCECGGRLKKGFRSSICDGCQRSTLKRSIDIDFEDDRGY